MSQNPKEAIDSINNRIRWAQNQHDSRLSRVVWRIEQLKCWERWKAYGIVMEFVAWSKTSPFPVDNQ